MTFANLMIHILHEDRNQCIKDKYTQAQWIKKNDELLIRHYHEAQLTDFVNYRTVRLILKKSAKQFKELLNRNSIAKVPLPSKKINGGQYFLKKYVENYLKHLSQPTDKCDNVIDFI
jgi:hypothetical protein